MATQQAGGRPVARIVVALVALLLALVGLGFLVSGAFFTSEDTGTDQVTTGTLDLEAGQPAGTQINLENLQPGDERTTTIEVRNTGTLELTYNVSSATSAAVPTSASTSGDPMLTAEVRLTDASGDVLYGPDTLAPVAEFFPTERHLAAQATETLHWTVRLSGDAGNEYQGLAATLELTFTANQVP